MDDGFETGLREGFEERERLNFGATDADALGVEVMTARLMCLFVL